MKKETQKQMLRNVTGGGGSCKLDVACLSAKSSATHIDIYDKTRKAAFTLAEVLITLAIIGVVAAIVLPAALANIKENVKSNQIKVITKKLDNAMSLLSTQGGIGPYYGETKDGTRLFINELSKYMKIAQVCDKTNIQSCIKYETLTRSNDEKKNVSAYFTDDGSGVGLYETNDHKYGEVLSIVLADGTQFVLTYDLRCKPVDPDSRNLNPSECLHGWYDINGTRGPNKWNEDIIGLNYGLGKAFLPTPLSQSECNRYKNKLGLQYCPCTGSDYFAGAVKQCGGVSNMVTESDINYIMSLIYTEDENGNLIDSPNASQYRNQIFGFTRSVGIWDKEYGNNCATVYKYFITDLGSPHAIKLYHRYFDGDRQHTNVNMGLLRGMCRGHD